jgi:uncharacterized protein
MNLSEDNIQAIIDEFSGISEILSIFLMGSAVNGVMNKDSDVDIALLPFNEPQTQNLKSMVIKPEFILRLKRNPDIGIISSKNLIYASQAIFYGKCIFTKDQTQHDFRVNTLTSMYLNFQYERREILNAYRIG